MAKHDAEKIRAALAAKGWGRSDVSVRNNSYSMGSTVHVTVKRAAIPLSEVEEIAGAFARIDRDDATGEILSGGNMFVDVRYADGVLDEQAARIDADVAAGRRVFGDVTLEEHDPFTLEAWHVNGTGPRRLDRKSPGAGLAGLLAAAGRLAVLHDTWKPEGEPANDAELTPAARDAAERGHPTPLGIDEMHAATSGAPLTRDEQDAAERAEGAFSRRWQPVPAPTVRTATPIERMRAAAALVDPAVLPPRFALVDASEAESATVRGALLVLTAAVESGSMPARAALEALAHLAYRVGRESH